MKKSLKTSNEDWRRLLEKEDGGNDCGQYEVMDQIQNYLDACDWFSFNPLRDLRKGFPQYEWSFHRPTSLASARAAVAGADFIWRVGWMDNMFVSAEPDSPITDFLITAALRVERARLKIFFQEENASEYSIEEKTSFIESCGTESI